MPFDIISGFTAKEEEEILAELNEEMVENIGSFIDVSEKTPLGVLNIMLAERLANLWSHGADIQDSFDSEKAYGAGLERLALQAGFYRVPASPSVGVLWGYGTHGMSAPIGSAFANLKRDRFVSTETAYFDRTSCLGLRLQVAEAVEDEIYIVYIDNVEYAYTATISDTPDTILQALEGLLQAEEETRVTAVYVPTPDPVTQPKAGYLLITVIDVNVPRFINSSPYCVDSYIKQSFLAESEENGYIFGAKGTITTIIGNVDGLKEVENNEDFVLGGYRETDEELRGRIGEDWNTVGSGTPATIDAIISREEGVRDAVVYENTTYEDTHMYGVPPKQYEVIVSHNVTDVQIAQLIWATRPLGIEPHGETSVTLEIQDNLDRTVEFTNAIEHLVTLNVSFLIYHEEEYPDNAEVHLAEALGVAGTQFGIGEDLLPQRLISALYETVKGVGQAEIEAVVPGKTTSKVWIPMGFNEIGLIAPARININATVL